MDVKNAWNIYINSISRLLPQPSIPASVGVDIGTRRIKVVELARYAGGYELRNFRTEPFDPASVTTVLKNILDGFILTDKILITAVSGKGTLIRYVDVPRMSNEELRKSLTYELDKYFPFDPGTIFYDCHVLDETLHDKKMAALVTAVKKELVEDRLKLFREAGYPLNQITTNAIATANAFSQLNHDINQQEDAQALLDIGGSISNLMIIHKRSPRFTRDIFIGAHDLTKQISNVFGVQMLEAEAMKIKPEIREDLLRACEDVLNNLIGEIRLSLDYFMTERNINVETLSVVGGGSQMEGLIEVLEKQLGLPVKPWQTLTGLKIASSMDVSQVWRDAPQLGVALGLALSGL